MIRINYTEINFRKNSYKKARKEQDKISQKLKNYKSTAV